MTLPLHLLIFGPMGGKVLLLSADDVFPGKKGQILNSGDTNEVRLWHYYVVPLALRYKPGRS